MRDIDGVLYCNDGDWVESCTSLVEDMNGHLRLIDWPKLREQASEEAGRAARRPGSLDKRAGPTPEFLAESQMNDACEMWSLPWHALQRNLAEEIGGNSLGYRGVARGTANSRDVFKDVFNVPAVAVPASSWLSRVQSRSPAAVQVRQ